MKKGKNLPIIIAIDNDSITSEWEWKYGYDPLTWDNHQKLDPDIDGVENIEEYMLFEFSPIHSHQMFTSKNTFLFTNF